MAAKRIGNKLKIRSEFFEKNGVYYVQFYPKNKVLEFKLDRALLLKMIFEFLPEAL